MSADPKIIDKINQQVYRKFPAVQGISPKVQAAPEDRIQLVYQGKAKTADGKSLPIIVRVVADSVGKILKLSTSR
jgi:hypothetical protein